MLLILMISHLGGEDEPLVFGIDETLERRWGNRISAKGIFRDAVRSTETHMVRASGLRWVSLMWLTQIPWDDRTRRSPTGARQMILQLRRWLPDRHIVIVTDMGYAALELLHSCQ